MAGSMHQQEERNRISTLITYSFCEVSFTAGLRDDAPHMQVEQVAVAVDAGGGQNGAQDVS